MNRSAAAVDRLEVAVDCRCLLGENPLWHTDERCLYWTDVVAGKIFRHDAGAGTTECVYDDEPVSGFTIQRDGSLLLFATRGRVRRLTNGGGLEPVLDASAWLGVEPAWHTQSPAYDVRDHFLNDVVADPRGRVYVGVLPIAGGGIFVVDRDRTVRLAAPGIRGANGLGFSVDRQRFFCTDSAPDVRRIYVFDYDVETGALTNRRTFAQVAPGKGLPDGLAVDAAGRVWSARWDGARVVAYAPDGRVEVTVDVPTRRATSVAFGGADASDLYVTTAAVGVDPADPAAGALYRLRTTATGLPELRSDVAVDRADSDQAK